MPEAAPLQPGDPSRLGDYPLAGRLGEGGQGVVYLGHAPDGEPVAVKLLRTRIDGDGTAQARFAREVAAAERVAPFCTARVITAELDGATPYVVSEYVEGPSLQARVRADGPLTGAALDRLAVATATALAAIHEAGIVHRDFKPGNVLLGPDGPRVIDFGIARVLDATATLSSQVVGTPAFLAPEQVNGDRIGPAADMFAWAATIVYAATGGAPFGDDTIPAVLNRIAHHEPDLGPLTGSLREVVAAALNKDPAQRPTPRQVLDHMMGGGRRPDAAPGAQPGPPPGPQPGTPPGTPQNHALGTPASPPPAAAPGQPYGGPPGTPLDHGLGTPEGPPPGAAPGPPFGGPPGMPPGQAPGQPPGPVSTARLAPAGGMGRLIGPGLGGLLGLYLLGVGTGPTGAILVAALHLTMAQLVMVPVGYLAAAALTGPVGALLGRRYPNTVAAVSAGLLLIGSLLTAFTPGFGLLVVGRVVSGLGAGALIATAVALCVGERRGSLYVIAPVAGLAALVSGPLLGGVLAMTLSWRWAYLIAAPLAILVLIATAVAGAVRLAGTAKA